MIEIVKYTQSLLTQSPEWQVRYANYAKEILNKVEIIKSKKKLFRQFSPLFLYMNISEAKGGGTFSLRYAGQQVADLKVRENEVFISTKKYALNNKQHFNCEINLDDALWSSRQTTKFRKYFLTEPVRSSQAKKANEEHRIESALLSEFSKKKSVDKKLLGIQPVRLFGEILRFQMPTPLTASGNEVRYSGANGGGIDILCRKGSGANTALCVIEVKDETIAIEPPNKAIMQAISYAVFLRELLRSSGGKDWYRIFGFKRALPQNLKIIAAIAMPYNEKIKSDFEGIELSLGGLDKLKLHSIYFVEQDRKFKELIWK